MEDNELNLDLLVQILEEDYVLLVARDGVEAVRLAASEHPDLVLMDIALPVMDGFEAARRIHRAAPGVPIIGLSSHAMPEDAAFAPERGCSDYLTKPLDEDLLLARVRALLK